MYQVKNKTYADAGNILKFGNNVAFSFKNVNIENVSEIKIDTDNIKIKDNFVLYGNGLKDFISCKSYEDWKKKIINKQFTNDDQIAIMLNKDDSEEDLLLFNKMQDWRVWSGMVAKKIVNLVTSVK